jgi:hypothetical protein
MMTRPQLTSQLSAEDFRSFYWLKEELVRFCRENGISASGSKEELAARVEAFLSSGNIAANAPHVRVPKAAGQMPQEFQRETVIGTGWRCSQSLRAFFEREIGPHFHFDSVMRDLIKHGAGKTLQETIEVWEAEQRQPKEAQAIAPQFEYNRHIREYFREHPGATLQEAIRAWEEKKAKRRE